ncbi:hypothetical protein AMTRI_Chr10g3250 [Amborella trichopoda]
MTLISRLAALFLSFSLPHKASAEPTQGIHRSRTEGFLLSRFCACFLDIQIQSKTSGASISISPSGFHSPKSPNEENPI